MSTIFLFGTSHDKPIPDEVLTLVEKSVHGNRFIIGDAPGFDTKMQDFLLKLGVKDVTVYTSYAQPRYIPANSGWNVVALDVSEFPVGSKEFLERKDIAMCKEADYGICAILSNGSKASRRNIDRMHESNKKVYIRLIWGLILNRKTPFA